MRNNNIKELFLAEKDKDIFILANGPSILDLDLNFLKNQTVIGMNASTLLEENFDFKSTYYVCSDIRFLTHPEKASWALEKLLPKTIRVLRQELSEVDLHTLENQTFYVKALQRDGFSLDLDIGYNYGCTTTMLAIQLASYLGAKNIYLLGADLRYNSEQPRFYKENSFQIDDSFTSIQIFNIVNAEKVLRERGINLHNCSEFSYLRPYIGYKNFFSLFKR